MVRQSRVPTKGSRPGRPGPAAPSGRRATELAIWFEGVKPWLPLIGTVFGGATVYLLSRVEAFQPTMGFLGGLAVIIGGTIYGMTRPEDAPVRVGRNKSFPLVLLTAAVILGTTLYPFVHTRFPGTPFWQGTLSPRKPRATFQLASDAALIEIVAHGTLRQGSGSASGGYELQLEHGGKDKTLTGSFKRTYSMRRIRRGRARVASTSEFTYHVSHVPSMGRGRYGIELVGVDATLRDHLRLRVFGSYYHERILFWGLGLLVALSLVTDVVSARVRHRTRLAQGALMAGGFAVFFAVRYTPDSIMSTTMGGALVGIVGGWLIGYILGVIAKKLGNEPKVAKAAASDDNE